MRTTTVCLEITYNPDFTYPPEGWDWQVLLDLAGDESVRIVHI